MKTAREGRAMTTLDSWDGTGPPQKERPHHPVRPPSLGSNQTALLSNTPAPASVQGRKEVRILYEQGVAVIPLTQGKVAIVDICDAERVSAYQWCALKSRHTWYAKTNWQKGDRTRTAIDLHRFVLEPPSGISVNHANGEGLDCRRSNLRFATRSQNGRSSKRRTDNTSGFKGASWDKINRNWRANIWLNGRGRFLGCFHSKEEAAAAYDRAAIQFFGEFARVNGAQAGKPTGD
jgi:hypothetical protein